MSKKKNEICYSMIFTITHFYHNYDLLLMLRYKIEIEQLKQ